MGGVVDGPPASSSGADSLSGDEEGRGRCDDDKKSTGSVDNSDGIVDGDSSDVGNFRAMLEGLIQRDLQIGSSKMN